MRISSSRKLIWLGCFICVLCGVGTLVHLVYAQSAGLLLKTQRERFATPIVSLPGERFGDGFVLVGHSLRLFAFQGQAPFSWRVDGAEVIASISRDANNTAYATLTGLKVGSSTVSVTDATNRTFSYPFSVGNITFETDPKYYRGISARSAWPNFGMLQAGTAMIKGIHVGTQPNWDMKSEIKWEVTGLESGQGYVPIGKGAVVSRSASDEWEYQAFLEPRGVGVGAVKTPQQKNAVLVARAVSDNQPIGQPIKMRVLPIFTWINGVNHQHTNGSVHDNAKNKETTRYDYYLLFLYTKWKYNI